MSTKASRVATVIARHLGWKRESEVVACVMDAKARGRPRTATPKEVMEVLSSSSLSGLDWE